VLGAARRRFVIIRPQEQAETGVSRREDAPDTEVVFRQANEIVRRMVAGDRAREERHPFICECPDPACLREVRLTVAEYEDVRAHSRRFVVAPGHAPADADTETVVSGNDRFDVVAKRGAAGELAERREPRHRGGR
jgi:hypothetical protein